MTEERVALELGVKEGEKGKLHPQPPLPTPLSYGYSKCVALAVYSMHAGVLVGECVHMPLRLGLCSNTFCTPQAACASENKKHDSREESPTLFLRRRANAARGTTVLASAR